MLTQTDHLAKSLLTDGNGEISASQRQLPVVLHARIITGSGGGPDKTILNSPRYLTQLGYACWCAFLRPPNDEGFSVIRSRSAHWKAPLIEIEDRGAFDWRILTAMLKVCRSQKVNIWHAHDYKTNLLGILLRRRHPMRLVTTVHGWVEYTWKTRLYYLTDRFSLPRYDKVICVSEDLRQTCRQLGVPESKCLLIENAIDTEQFRRGQTIARAKEQLNWPATRWLIGAVGRLSAEKGFDRLIQATALLVRGGADVGLIIAGNGSERAALQALVDELGMTDRIRLVGFQSDLRPIYEAMDVFALSSLREGLPNVVLEAMALEVPVVATSVAGVPRLIDHGVNGWLVPAGDVAILAQTIGDALSNPAQLASAAAAGRRTIESNYSFAVRMQKMASVYDQLLTSPTTLPRPK